ncbi:hypothetical protein ACM66B_005371 [Microbotryomycetes sp. NB124-2]
MNAPGVTCIDQRLSRERPLLEEKKPTSRSLVAKSDKLIGRGINGPSAVHFKAAILYRTRDNSNELLCGVRAA